MISQRAAPTWASQGSESRKGNPSADDFRTFVTSELDALRGKLLVEFDKVTSCDSPTAPVRETHISLEPLSRALSLDDCKAALRRTYEAAGTIELDRFEGPRSSEACSVTRSEGEDDDSNSENGVCVSRTTFGKQMAIRNEWVPDSTQVRSIIDEAQTSSPAELATRLQREATRVMKEIRASSGWGNHTMSASQSLPSWMHMSRLETAEFWAQGNPIMYFHLNLPLDRNSPGHLLWDIAGLLFVVYDAVMIPLVLMVLQGTSARAGMSVIVNIFWTIDIGVNFLTATVLQDGTVKTNLADIAKQYAKTWLALDTFLVLSEWFTMLLRNNTGGFTLMRTLKVFRAFRLLRLVKMEGVLREQLKRVNSEILLHMMSLAQLIFAFLMLNHNIACGWYAIGHATGNGWFERHDVASFPTTSEGYLLALHWSITQFHGSSYVTPGNTSERVFAVITLVCGMLTFSVFVSVITDMIFQVRHVRKSRRDQDSALRSYFARHAVSTQLMLNVKMYLKLHVDVNKHLQDAQEWLQLLPEQLGKSLLREVRQPTVENHLVFAWMSVKHWAAFRDMCYFVLVSKAAVAGHSVFANMDACTQMYFVESGTLRYLPISPISNTRTSLKPMKERLSVGPASRHIKQISRLKLGVEVIKKRWACEPALWVQAWQTHGELVALTNSVLLCLETSRFAQVISCYPQFHFDVSVYAHFFVRELKSAYVSLDENLHLDLWVPSDSHAADEEPSFCVDFVHQEERECEL